MNSRLREQAIKLRLEKECSYSEIRKRLGVPKSTLSGWLRELPLTKERILELQRDNLKRNEAKIERYRNAMRKKREYKDLKIYKKYQKTLTKAPKITFFVAGLMLYLGEGEKANNTRIALANTDPRIIKFFIKWLIDFLDVDKKDIKSQLHLYENMDIKKEKNFWKKELGLDEKQFYKAWITKLKEGSFSYRESYRHGTCSIFLLGVEKKREITMAIKAFVDKHIK